MHGNGDTMTWPAWVIGIIEAVAPSIAAALKPTAPVPLDPAIGETQTDIVRKKADAERKP
jgi:hypothetical protein